MSELNFSAGPNDPKDGCKTHKSSGAVIYSIESRFDKQLADGTNVWVTISASKVDAVPEVGDLFDVNSTYTVDITKDI